MLVLAFIFGIFIGFLIFEALKTFVIYNAFKSLEMQILLVASSLMQYKYHAIKIVEISYNSDESKEQECQRVIAKIHEKFDSFGDSVIQNLINRLPYKTQYNDLKTAILYVEQLITNNKQS